MADGELYNWMRSMDACHEKHIGGPPPLHRRVAYEAAYSNLAVEESPVGLWGRVAALARRLVGRKRCQGAE